MLFGDFGQRLECPGVGLSIERWVVGVIDQLRYCGQALLVSQHSGFRKAACGSFANYRRGIAVHGIEQWDDG